MFMKKLHVSLVIICLLFCFSACKKEIIPVTTDEILQQNFYNPAQLANAVLSEDFETGTKTTYTNEKINLSSGKWIFANALIGTTKNDHKSGAQSARIRGLGKLTMNFDIPQGISMLTIDHAVFGSDGVSTWELRISTDGGTTWTKNGSTINTSSANLTTQIFYININAGVRISIVKTGGNSNKINIDNIVVYPYKLSDLPDNDHMLFGNPSNAVGNTSFQENYLMVKPYYALSYSRTRGEPNWVCWHLQASDVGSTPRQDNYRPDSSLPASWYWVTDFSYTGSGFDRGHNCPSGDRTSSIPANSATFLMTNMIPQAPHNNQLTWASLEDTCRLIANAGNELYIIMGSYGTGGTGLNGTVNSIDNGHVNVPSNIWKVVVVLPLGNNDINRVTAGTRVIAINTPNINTTLNSWKSYRTSVSAIESATGYNILSNLPAPLQTIIKAKIDNL